MLKTLARTAAALLALAVGFGTAPAFADTSEALASGVVSGANAGIKNAMTAPQAPTVAQVPPVSQSPVGGAVGLPTGFGYTADFSVAYPS